MSEVIFPTQIPNGTPASDDRFLFSDTSDSNASKDAPLSDLPISTATQTAIDGKQDTLVSGTNIKTVNGNSLLGAGNVAIGGTGTVDSIVAGTNISVDSTDPANPVVSLSLGADENFVTDAEKTVLGNTSGTNTGDQDLSNLVVGPASATDNALARFDSTTGKVIQNSAVTLDDTANMAGLNEIHFVLSPAPSAYSEGTLRWNPTDKTLDIEVGNNSTLQVGQEMFIRVRNNTGVQVNNGQLVYINGALGNRPTVALAKADSEATAHTLIGMATDDIANDADGFITVMGTVNDLNTSAFTDGQEIYLSASTAGAFTATAPSSPNFVVKVGIVARAHATQGQVLIQTQIRTVSASNIRGTVAIGNGGTGLSALGTANQQLRVNSGATALEYFTPSASGGGAVAQVSWAGPLVAGTLLARVTVTSAKTLAYVKASLGVLNTGASVLIDVRKNGTATTNSIFTSDSPLDIATSTSATNGVFTVTKTAIDNGSVVENDVLYIYATQVGSGVSGADLYLEVN